MKSVHEGDKYNCELCDHKATTTKGSLHIHVKSIHEGLKYNCGRCEHKATQNGDLC